MFFLNRILFFCLWNQKTVKCLFLNDFQIYFLDTFAGLRDTKIESAPIIKWITSVVWIMIQGITNCKHFQSVINKFMYWQGLNFHVNSLTLKIKSPRTKGVYSMKVDDLGNNLYIQNNFIH